MALSVNTVTAFLTALLDVEVTEIILTSDIDFKEYGIITETKVLPTRNVIIDLNEKKIRNIYPAIGVTAFSMPVAGTATINIKNGFIENLMHNESTFFSGNSSATTGNSLIFNNVGFSSVSAGSTSEAMLSKFKVLKFSNCSMYRKWRNVYKINESVSSPGGVYESCTIFEDDSTYKDVTGLVRNSIYKYCLFNGKAHSNLIGKTAAHGANYFPYATVSNCCFDGVYTGAFGKANATYTTAVRNDCVQNDGVTPCIYGATFVTPLDLEDADALLNIGLLAVQGT